MATQIEYIDVPPEWESTNDWDSHRPALWVALNHCKEALIVEVGCGNGSTPLIDTYCQSHENMEFCSLETNEEWAKRFAATNLIENYQDGLMGFRLVYADIDLLFIDCAPGELRKELIKEAADFADVIVIHDTEPAANYVYRMAGILATFKYRLDYRPEGKPWTTIISDSVNVEEWIKE